MLNLTINGENQQRPSQTVLQLVITICNIDPPPLGIAVAINGMVVRRTDWEHTQLNTHDDIEILWASSGG